MINKSHYTSLATICALFLCFFPTNIHAQQENFKQRILRLVLSAEGIVGVGIMGLEDGDSLTIHGKERFPMQSVYKFPLALAVLHQVDKVNSP